MPLCTVQGRITDAAGTPMQAVGVRVLPTSERNVPIFNGDALVARESMSTITDENGEFSINVLQGLRVTITVDNIGYSKQVTIPEEATVNFKDL